MGWDCGREFWQHMTSRKFAFPGEPGGLLERQCHHDLTHVLTGYDTDPDGEFGHTERIEDVNATVNLRISPYVGITAGGTTVSSALLAAAASSAPSHLISAPSLSAAPTAVLARRALRSE